MLSFSWLAFISYLRPVQLLTLLSIIAIQSSAAFSQTATPNRGTDRTPTERTIAKRLRGVPDFYRTLFIKGTTFRYKVSAGRDPNESARSEAEPTIVQCEIVDVSICQLGLQSKMDCSPRSVPWIEKVLPRYFLAEGGGLRSSMISLATTDFDNVPAPTVLFSKYPKPNEYSGDDHYDYVRRDKVKLPDGRTVSAWCKDSGSYNAGSFSDAICIAPGAGIVSANYDNVPEYCFDSCGDDCSSCEPTARIHEQIKIKLVSVQPPATMKSIQK